MIGTQFPGYGLVPEGARAGLIVVHGIAEHGERYRHVAQAFANYMSNALKFTPPGGRVLLRTRREGEHVRAEFCDSGPGVPPAERPRLFQDNARLSPRPTAGEESHGLGLAIVKNLIETQGGQVGADFPSEGGSIFWFELKMAH